MAATWRLAGGVWLAAFALAAGAAELLPSRPDAPDLTPLATLGESAGSPIEIVNAAGVALPVVVDRGGERELKAAEYLARTIADITGVAPAVLTNAAVRPALVLAATAADGDEGFRVAAAADGSVVLSGRADFAAYDYAERVLGVRHYWPAARGGKSVPRQSTLAVRRWAYADSPVFAYRLHYPYDHEDWVRVAKMGAAHDLGFRVHSTNPGYCYGSPAAFADYTRRIEERLQGIDGDDRIASPWAKVISLSPWDEEYACLCAWCRTRRSHTLGVAGSASPIVWSYFLPRLSHYLAAAHPDWHLVCLAYWNYVLPPPELRREDLASNVVAYVCTVPGMAMLKDARLRQRDEATLRRWAELTGRKVFNWDYACWPANRSVAPYVYGHTIRERLNSVREVLEGTFICGTDDNARQALSLYVWQRCLWNPDFDVEACYDEFCRRMFGRAAKPMRKLVELQEELWQPPEMAFEPVGARQLQEQLLEAESILDAAEGPEAALYRLRFRHYLAGFTKFFAAGARAQ